MASNIVVPISGVTSEAYDQSDGLLLAVTSGGIFYEIDPSTGTIVDQTKIGSDLSSVAVSLDGSFALVGEGDSTGGQNTVYRVDLSSLAATTLNFPFSTGYNDGVNDVVIAADGNAYVATVNAGSGFNAISVFASTSASGDVETNYIPGSYSFPTFLATSETGRFVLISPGDISSGGLYIYI